MMTSKGADMPDNTVKKYLVSLIGQFYKILPIKESGEPSLNKYIDSLQREIIGFHDLMTATKNDGAVIGLLSILEFLSNNECDVSVVKCEIFKAINICKKIIKRYFNEEV